MRKKAASVFFGILICVGCFASCGETSDSKSEKEREPSVKERIRSADDTAKDAYKYVNIAIEELSEQAAQNPLPDGIYSLNADLGTDLETAYVDGNGRTIVTTIEARYDESEKLLSEEFAVFVEGGYVKCAAAKNGDYYGTYPAVLNKSNYKDMLKDDSFTGALRQHRTMNA